MNQHHLNRIINCYKSAPINQLYKPEMHLEMGKCEIEIEIKDEYFHSANSLHGSIYFKMLDDAAWAASNTYVEDVFLFTSTFTITLAKPVSSGIIKSEGTVINQTSDRFVSKSVLLDSNNIQIAKGAGVFLRSKNLLKDSIGFK